MVYKYMEKIKYESSNELKNHLKRGDYQLIAEILKDIYSPHTVKSQLLGHRTLKRPVIEAANKLIKMRELLIA